MNNPIRYVGVLVNASMYRNIAAGRSTFEQVRFYEESAAEFGMRPCFLRLSDIQPGAPYAAGLIRAGKRYKRRWIPYPSVIHNRAIIPKPKIKGKLAQIHSRGTPVFNLKTRYDKWRIHRLLASDPGLLPHLPATEKAVLGKLETMRQQYPALILKPANGSVGQGIMLLRRTDDGYWELTVPRMGRKPGAKNRYRFRRVWPRILLSRLKRRSYLIQEWLPLAQVRGRPFDLRVTVQRNELGEWQIAGMVGKLARKGSFLTNVAQGGKAMPLQELFAVNPQLDPERTEQEIRDVSLKIAAFLGENLRGLADLGMDIGVTEDGRVMFIEANGRDQRYSFREAGMLEEWRATYRNPMAYAHFLSNCNKSP